MVDRGRRAARSVAAAAPIAALILGFTAVPTEVRLPGRADVLRAARLNARKTDLPDVVVNVVGYAPLGAALAGRGLWQAAGAAASASLLAEVVQLFAAGRSASLLDVILNVAGALLGFVLARRCSVVHGGLRIDRFAASMALVLAAACAGVAAVATPRDIERQLSSMILAPPWLATSPRGATAEGTLEAHWTFDDGAQGGVAVDQSGHGLDAVPVSGPTAAPGVRGGAVRLNGVDQWLDAGSPRALRLTGSLSIAAWIRSSRFPPDDAAIVSSYGGLGYQLDTTADSGPRTISFKLADPSARPMIRYGATPLETGRWYHVAGVYDASARTLNVYLDGRLDNGRLCGTVSDRQHASAFRTFLGRRSDERGFEFAGDLDDVRIYSRALGEAELAEAAARPGGGASSPAALEVRLWEEAGAPVDSCGPAEPTDARLCGLIVAVGLLSAVAVAGLWPTTGWRAPALLLSLAAGFLLWPLVSYALPAPYSLLVPLLTLVGGLSVVGSARRPVNAA